MSAPIELLLDRLAARGLAVRGTGPGRWMAACPAHDDRSPSLSLRNRADPDGDRVLVNCFAGCAAEDVLAALGLDFGDLYDRERPREPRRPGRTLPPVVRAAPVTTRGDRPADRMLVALSVAGCAYRAHALVDYMWHARCPCCNDPFALLVEETDAGGVRVGCRNFCNSSRIGRLLAAAVRRQGGWSRRP